MHKSQLSSIVIDCNANDLDEAASFWSAALGWQAKPLPNEDDANYRELAGPDDEVKVLVQCVDHPSRAHIDIEADDIEAEVRRLEALGARRVEFVRRWWVMEAPTGQRFCVIKPQRSDFESRAHAWQE
jgi:predicted enzyme related to lactoylglutathione lyase